MTGLNIKKACAQDIYTVATNNVDKQSVKEAARLMIEQMMHSLVEVARESISDPAGAEFAMPDTQAVKHATVDFLRDMLMDLEESLVAEILDANVTVKIKPVISFEATLESTGR